MQDLLSIGTNRRESMIGTGIGLGLAGYRLSTSFEAMPSLDLQFADRRMIQAVLGPTPSFSRASTGTYFDSQGVLESAAVNGPRFNHTFNGTSWVSRGLLIEEQRTNICSWSEQLNDASWNFKTNITVSANFGNAPDGNATADLIYPTANGASCEIGKSVGTVNTSLVHTNSFYLKSSGKTWAKILSIRGSVGAWFNLSNGTVGTVESGASATIQNVGNGWYRCTVSRAPIDFATGYSFVLVCDSDNSIAVTASGTNGILVWGAQAEIGSFPTSYIPTTSASVTRSADVCQITGGDFSSIWNETEGSIAVDFDRIGLGGDQMPFRVNSPTKPLYYFSSGANEFYQIFGASTALTISGVSPANTTVKTAIAFRDNDTVLSRNGAAVLSPSSMGLLPTNFDAINLGRETSGAYLNGHIARLRYYRKRLPNATLQQLST